MSETDTNDIIETIDENGEVIKFNLFDIFEYEDKEYAILLPIEEDVSETDDDDDDDDDDDRPILVRLLQEGEEYSFEVIDDDDEFEKVSKYVISVEEGEE